MIDRTYGHLFTDAEEEVRGKLDASGEADDGGRTRDLRLGKPMLYQLSYVRARPILSR